MIRRVGGVVGLVVRVREVGGRGVKSGRSHWR